MSTQLAEQEVHLLRRRKQAIIRRRRLRFGGAFLLSIIAIAGYAVFTMVDRSTAQVTGTELLVTEPSQANGPVDGTGPAHPVFARIGERNLVLPVQASSATIIAYHPLSDDRAIGLTPLGEKTNAGVVSRNIGRVFSDGSAIRYYLLADAQDRSPVKTGSVDVGAPAGTPIVSPVSGVVTGVTEYRLYGKYDDVQIDIAPDGVSDVIVTLLFVDEPSVKIGETVEEGKTRLGVVRAPQGDLGERLAVYSLDQGAHVHIQAIRTVLAQ